MLDAGLLVLSFATSLDLGFDAPWYLVALVTVGYVPAMPALLRHRDPQGRELETQRVRIDDRGLATFGLDLPGYALTGHHTLQLVVAEKVIGQYRFQVEEFVPDRIGVEIVPPGKRLGPGEELASVLAGIEPDELSPRGALDLVFRLKALLAGKPD